MTMKQNDYYIANFRDTTSKHRDMNWNGWLVISTVMSTLNTGFTPSMEQVLSEYGYDTAAFGKWHNTPIDNLFKSGPFDQYPTGPLVDDGMLCCFLIQWIGLREILQEIIYFPLNLGFSCKFSLTPIHWLMALINGEICFSAWLFVPRKVGGFFRAG